MQMVIPAAQLQPETVRALIEEFITREGAVHGHQDVALETQIEAVQRQLRGGQAAIVFDDETETTTIVPARDLRSLP